MLLPFLASILLFRTGIVPFDRAVHRAKAIVIGRVEHIASMQGHLFANLTVKEVLKGDPGREVWCLAESTWSCERIHAKEGESGIFMLYPMEDKQRWIAGDPNLAAAIRRIKETGSVFCLGNAGEGQILDGNIEPAQAWNGGWLWNGFLMPKAILPKKDVKGRLSYPEDRLVEIIRHLVSHE